MRAPVVPRATRATPTAFPAPNVLSMRTGKEQRDAFAAARCRRPCASALSRLRRAPGRQSTPRTTIRYVPSAPSTPPGRQDQRSGGRLPIPLRPTTSNGLCPGTRGGRSPAMTRSIHTRDPGSTSTAPPPLRRRTRVTPASAHASRSTDDSGCALPRTRALSMGLWTTAIRRWPKGSAPALAIRAKERW